MTDLAQALRAFAELFEQMGIRYVVMGGLAVRVHGIPRPTHDVDFTLAISRERLPELYARVRALGFTVPQEYEGGWVDQVAGMPLVKFRLYLHRRGVDIDAFLAETPFQEQILSRRQRVALDNLEVWLVSPEDLILLKLLAGRPRDIADIGDILFTQGRLDEAYLRRNAKSLGVLDALERLLAQPPA
jgi:predicted nucleotidyltransferase